MISTILAQAEPSGPLGPEFGKASPVGLLIMILLLVVVLYLGYSLTRRVKRMARRRAFAEANGIDLFDTQALDAAMEKAGVKEKDKFRYF